MVIRGGSFSVVCGCRTVRNSFIRYCFSYFWSAAMIQSVMTQLIKMSYKDCCVPLKVEVCVCRKDRKFYVCFCRYGNFFSFLSSQFGRVLALDLDGFQAKKNRRSSSTSWIFFRSLNDSEGDRNWGVSLNVIIRVSPLYIKYIYSNPIGYKWSIHRIFSILSYSINWQDSNCYIFLSCITNIVLEWLLFITVLFGRYNFLSVHNSLIKL